jgi:hypothetical protein
LIDIDISRYQYTLQQRWWYGTGGGGAVSEQEVEGDRGVARAQQAQVGRARAAVLPPGQPRGVHLMWV